MTRHELKDQLQHDQFTDAVSGAVTYASSHRQALIKWGAVAAVVLVVGGGVWWYLHAQAQTRQQDLSAALTILDAQVGQPNPDGRTYATDAAKAEAFSKAISDVANKYSGTPEGLIAQYYRGTDRSQKNDLAGAEADLRIVSSSSAPIAPLAKVALANVYLGEKKTSDAQALLQDLVKDPSPLVSKAQAQILQAQLGQVSPQTAQGILKTIDPVDSQRAAVKQAATQINAQLAK